MIWITSLDFSFYRSTLFYFCPQNFCCYVHYDSCLIFKCSVIVSKWSNHVFLIILNWSLYIWKLGHLAFYCCNKLWGGITRITKKVMKKIVTTWSWWMLLWYSKKRLCMIHCHRNHYLKLSFSIICYKLRTEIT